MLRKTLVTVSVMLALVAAITGLASLRREVVFWDRQKPSPFRKSTLNPRLRLSLSGGALRAEYIRMTLDPPADWSIWPGPGSMSGGVGKPTRTIKNPLFEWEHTRYGDVTYRMASYSGVQTTSQGHVRIPLWGPMVLFLLYPAINLVRGPLRRWRRRRKGLCLRCGYDLRGNASGVCPECGLPMLKP